MLTNIRSLRRGLAACVALIVALSMAGCTSSKHHSSSGGSSATATRWWSNSATTVGSLIDPAKPAAVAGKLHPSQADYCGMLKQTLDARKSILPNATAADPALLTSTEAFVAEIEQVAPASVTDSWQLLGPAIIDLVKSGGQIPTTSTGQTARNLQAAQAISDDAKKTCGLDLSAVVTG